LPVFRQFDKNRNLIDNRWRIDHFDIHRKDDLMQITTRLLDRVSAFLMERPLVPCCSAANWASYR
jgi:hypothetical protein